MNNNRYLVTLAGECLDTEKGEWLTIGEVFDTLNKQDETIQRYQFIIKDALRRERTQLGQNVLRQLAEALEIEI